jgi:hypothetical protein
MSKSMSTAMTFADPRLARLDGFRVEIDHERERADVICQSASKFDPLSASNFDPLWRRVLAVAIAPSEVVGVAETARAPAVVPPELRAVHPLGKSPVIQDGDLPGAGAGHQ